MLTVWAILKIVTFEVNTAATTFGATFRQFGLLFIPTFGHPERVPLLLVQVVVVVVVVVDVIGF